MGVVGVDSVVVEGWASCFVVGLVLGLGQGGYFGELALAPVGLPGDSYWIVGLRVKMCVWLGVSRGLDLAFLFADSAGAVIYARVVVEGWASCFVVGLVLGLGQGGYFGELALAPVGLPGDSYWIVRQFRF